MSRQAVFTISSSALELRQTVPRSSTSACSLVLICLLQSCSLMHHISPPPHPIHAANLIILLRLARPNTTVQHTTALVEVEAEEKGDANPLTAAPVLHSVHRAHVPIIGDTLEIVGNVDHEGALDGLGTQPLSVVVEDL